MQKIYCVCGNASLYEIKKPSLCGFCGNAFDKAFKIEVKPVVAKVKRPAEEVSYNDEDNVEEAEASVQDLRNMKRAAKAAAKRVQIAGLQRLKTDDLRNMESRISRS